MAQLALASNGKALFDLKEAEQISNISSWTLRRDIRAKKLACFRRGGARGKILIGHMDLQEYLTRYRYAAIGETSTRKG